MFTRRVGELLNDRTVLLQGDTDRVVESVEMDSRAVTPGAMFIARRGETVDGHTYISDAIRRGAVVVVGEEFSHDVTSLALEKKVSLVQVRDSVHDGGVLVAAFYGFPFLKMKMIGVTGTDGKTTTTNVVYHLLKSLGKKVGLISTVSAKIFNGEREYEMETGLHVTTPEVTEIQRLLAEMVHAGCEFGVVEATSHGFVQGRLVGINFDVVGITNITHEHLDYHRTFEAYLAAKAMIFEVDPALPDKNNKRIAYINDDDEHSEGFRDYAVGWEMRTYSLHNQGLLNAEITEMTIEYSTFLLGHIEYRMRLVGAYNVANVTLALGICQALGITLESMAQGVTQLQNPPGRFEVIDGGEHGHVVIDFAHTPHAMESVLSFVRNHHQGKVYVVFGCAGQRDVDKRPMMGRVAGRLADVVIVTAEDPRMETVESISDQIVAGLEIVGANDYEKSKEVELKKAFNVYLRIPDRKEAIRTAIQAATGKDVVMILGKGHEKSMCFGTQEMPWSDTQAVLDTLEELKRV